MTDLIKFLTDRLDEDAEYVVASRVAGIKAASDPETTLSVKRFGSLVLADQDVRASTAVFVCSGVLPPNDLDRIVRDLTVKRHIIDVHHEYLGVCAHCAEWAPTHHDRELWPCLTMRLLAQPYDNHPDFDPEWKR